MKGVSAAPEVQFRVGLVRVAIWPVAAVDLNTPEHGGYQVTVERQCRFSREREYTDVLDAEDIPKAILALKKAHDYIRGRVHESEEAGEFHSAFGFPAPRIP